MLRSSVFVCLNFFLSVLHLILVQLRHGLAVANALMSLPACSCIHPPTLVEVLSFTSGSSVASTLVTHLSPNQNLKLWFELGLKL